MPGKMREEETTRCKQMLCEKSTKYGFFFVSCLVVALFVQSSIVGCGQQSKPNRPKPAVQNIRTKLERIARKVLRKRNLYPSDHGYKIKSVEFSKEKHFGNSFLGKNGFVGKKRHVHVVRFIFDGKYHSNEWIAVYIDSDTLTPIGGDRCK